MKISYLQHLSKFQISQNLQEHEHELLTGIQGNFCAILAGYRLASRWVARHGSTPSLSDLSPRLSRPGGRPGMSRGAGLLDGKTFVTICRRINQCLIVAAESALVLVGPKKVTFEDDPQLERQLRERMYRSQIEALDRRAAELSKQFEGDGPTTKPVYCKELRKWFESAADAARYLSAESGKTVSRSHVRSAIVRGTACIGWKFSYDGPESTKPVARIVHNRNGLWVRCMTLHEPFRSIKAAAKFAGVSFSTMKTAMAGDGKIGGYQFEYCDRDEIVVPPVIPDVVEVLEPQRKRFEQLALIVLESGAMAARIPNFSKLEKKKRRRAEVEGQSVMF